MRLIVLQQGAMIADVVCGEEAVYVGARADCRVRLETGVPEQAAVFYPEGDGWTLSRLASTDLQMLLNGADLRDKAVVRTGDELRVAEYSIRIYPEHLEQPTGRLEVGTSKAQLERFIASRLPPGTTIKRPDEPVTLQGPQLVKIGQVGLSASQCVMVEELMDVVLRTLLTTFTAQRVWLGVRRVNYGPMEYVEGRLLTGQSTDLPEVGGLLKARVLDRSQFVVVPLSTEDRTSILAGPLLVPESNLGMIYMDTGNSGRRFEPPDVDLFILLAGVFAVQLDAIFRQIARNRAAMVAGEVAVAHDIQSRLTPRKLPQWEDLQFGAFREPGRVNTGDIYDVVRLANGMAAFMVAHTTARGTLPSMLMAQAQAAFRSACMHQDPPHVFLRSLNHLLYDGAKDHPLNCCVGIVDPPSGDVRYAIAGRTGAFVVGNRGEERPLGGEEPSRPLGTVKSAVYPLFPERLERAETMVVFTPGVTTAKSRRQEVFGEERFVNILCDGFGQLASATLKEMLTDLRNFTEGGSQPDDITVLLLHRVDR